MARKIKIEKSKLKKIVFLFKDTKSQGRKLKKKTKMGEREYKFIFDFLTKILFLSTNFNPSERACNKPKYPITLGPFLL